jgi:predicted O-methyltransferase YrrM
MTEPINAASWSYAENYVAEDDVLAAARARADEVGVVAIGSGGGAALRFLASVLEARAVVEVGTGTGVSGLWLLRGMRGDGVLTTVDIETEHQRLARETFNDAGIPTQRARTIAGAALDVLPRLTDGHYDLVFLGVPQGGRAAPAPRRSRGVRQRPVARPGRRPLPAGRRDDSDP